MGVTGQYLSPEAQNHEELAMQEFTLSSALSDPLIRTLMAADNVNPVKLESMLIRIVEETTPKLAPREACRFRKLHPPG